MDREELVRRFQAIKVWKRHGVSAPHKPLLILYALGKLLKGESRLLPFSSFDDNLENLLSEFSSTGPPQGTNYPFWRLQNDGLWEVVGAEVIEVAGGGNPSKGDLHSHNVRGGFTEEIFNLFKTETVLAFEIAQMMLESHFAANLHSRVLHLAWIDDFERDSHLLARWKRSSEGALGQKDSHTKAKAWSNSEVDAIVRDYLVMLEHEQMGRAFNKAEHRRALMQTIGRSKGSIERKHMNISAVMDDLGLPYIKGYKPYRHYQSALFETVKAHLMERHDLYELLTGEAGKKQQDPKAMSNVHASIDFRYWNNGRNLPLPSWALFYMQLGAAVAEQNDAERHLVTALAVPSRSYAAVLVAAGAVISMAKTGDRHGQISHAAHFEMLKSLPAGTSVILDKGGKVVKGILVGTKDVMNDGTAMIGVQIQNKKGGSLTEWLPPESSSKVQVSLKAWPQLPANAAKSTAANTSSSKFVGQIFRDADLWDFITNSTLDCVILGSAGPLEHEVTDTKLSVGSQRREASAGRLRDILRIRRLSSDGEAFRSDIFPVNPRGKSMTSEGMSPHLVIFDGAVGFLKWRDIWSHCNWVVILDRTESRFAEAVHVVNEEHLSRIDDENLKLPGDPPVSVELVSFTAAR